MSDKSDTHGEGLDPKALEAAKDVMRSGSGILIMGGAFDATMEAAIRAYTAKCTEQSDTLPSDSPQITYAWGDKYLEIRILSGVMDETREAIIKAILTVFATQPTSVTGSDTAGPSDHAGLVERPWLCDITGNPVGTDTRMIGAPPCDCQGCRAAEAIAALSRATEAVSRRDGHSKLVYNKKTRTIDTVDPHPPAPEPALASQGEAAQPAADGPVPTYECPFVIGQRVKLAAPYAEEDPNRVFFITEIRWEYRQVAHRGWNITIAPSNDIERGYGATDGFSPSDLSPTSPGIASQAEEGSE